MKVFISWSGSRAGAIASALRKFIEDVNHRLEPWMSDIDISPGARWGTELARELEHTGFGIVCLTHEAQRSPWVLFEAGAVSKSVEQGRLCPYLIGVERKDVVGPLVQFQATVASENGTWDLMAAINAALGVDALPEARLRRYFNIHWADLQAEIEKVLSAESEMSTRKIPNELVEQLNKVLISSFDTSDLKMLYRFGGLPCEEVNWSQALVHVGREAIDVAIDKKMLRPLFEKAVEERPGRPDVAELLAKIPHDA